MIESYSELIELSNHAQRIIKEKSIWIKTFAKHLKPTSNSPIQSHLSRAFLEVKFEVELCEYIVSTIEEKIAAREGWLKEVEGINKNDEINRPQNSFYKYGEIIDRPDISGMSDEELDF